MNVEDIGKLAGRALFLSLDRIVAPRMIKILYLSGVAAVVLWALNHLFATFRFGFGEGLWGLLEVAVFGVFGLVALRTLCEWLIVYFKANQGAVDASNNPASQSSLIDEVRDAIEDLAAEDLEEIEEPPAKAEKPKRVTKPSAPPVAAKRNVRPRTARRTPAKKS